MNWGVGDEFHFRYIVLEGTKSCSCGNALKSVENEVRNQV